MTKLENIRFLLLTVVLLLLLPPPQTLCGPFELDLNEPPPEEIDEEDFSHETPVSTAGPFQLLGAPKGAACESRTPGGIKNFMHKFKANAINSLKKLPGYFDFDQFRRKFNKEQYKSPAEFIYRKSVYLKRCMKVFKARIKDRLGKLRSGGGSFKIEVNKFSDRSPNEIKRMFMSAPPIELKPKGQSVEEYQREMERNYQERETWDMELESQASLDSSRPISEADKTYTQEGQVNKEIEELFNAIDDDDTKLAILDEIEGRDCEVESQADLNSLGGNRKPLPWPFQQSKSLASQRSDDEAYVPPKLVAGLSEHLNWSEHECFHTIYDQKEKCGKCYVMATTTLAEFFKCAEQKGTINKRKFSKEFVLDCAVKYKPATIYGCKGGSMLDTMKFIAEAGVYNIRGWKSRSKQELSRLGQQSLGMISPLDERCPFNEFETPFERWGDIPVRVRAEKVHVNDWFAALQDGPLVASVQMPEGVELYKSGVHDGQGCETSKNWHTMLLVGYGLDENGLAYWRFRNSFGPDWGDQGHFNLAMSVSSKCLIGGVRIFRTED